MTARPLPGPTSVLGTFVAECRELEFGESNGLRARAALLDAIGLALAAHDESTTRAYRSLSQPIRDSGAGCRIWGEEPIVSVLDGLTCNALATHARFQDDCDMKSWAHPGSLITPVAIGLGEAVDADLSQVLRGILCGYATLQWLGADEAVGRAVVERGLRASPTLGPIAAAATAAVLLGLDPATARNAVAIATDIAGGGLEPVRSGASDWRVQNATAAYRGALAALLAARGVDGPEAALEGPAGFLRSFAGLDEPPRAWQQPPDPGAIDSVWAKPYPTLGDNIAVAATALAAREAIADPAEIRSVTVHQNAHFASYPGTSFRGPFTRAPQALASTAFATAASLLYGPIRYEFYDRLLTDPSVTELIDRIQVVPEPEFGYLDASVDIELADGSHVRRGANELPRSLFFRDEATASVAFHDLMIEVGRKGSVAGLPGLVFSGAAGLKIRAVIDLTIAETATWSGTETEGTL